MDRYRGEFLELMRSGTVDLVFANEAELHSLYETSDFDTALAQLRADAKLGVVTRSEKGCVVASTDRVIAVPAFPIERMVDTTGAGDLFAAGFLFGLVRDADYENAGRLGALAAAEVIQHIGDLNMTRMMSALPDFTNDVDLYPDMMKKWGLSFLINTAQTLEGRRSRR